MKKTLVRVALAAACAMTLLSACGGGDSGEGSSDAESSASPNTPSQSASAPKELGTLVKSGFGQRDEYVWVSAIVHNNSAHVGQTVTVNFNVLDDKGELLKSGSQVESFSIPEADHILGTQLDLSPGQKAAKVEATVDVEAVGTFSDKPFPKLPTSKVKVDTSEYGGYQASFELSNPTTTAVKDPRISLACTDAGGAIIGGTSNYPELIAAGGKVRVEADVTVSEEPADCLVFVGAPVDWDGGESGSSAAPAAPSSSAEAAFKVWVDQFTKKDWKAQYATLTNSQKKLLSEAEYVRCRESEDVPTIKWSKGLGSTDVGEITVPGTKEKAPATKVEAEVTVSGVELPVDAHMLSEDGVWKWSLTQENVDGCVK